MSYVIRITSDIGELRIWLVTVFLVKPMNDELLGRVKSLVSECPGSLITIIPARRVLNAWHMVYPAYLSLRDHLRGVSRFRDPGLGALTYMAGTTQLSRGLSILNPVGNNQLSIIVMGIYDCVHSLVVKVIDLLRDFMEDLIVGVGCHRAYDSVFKSFDDFMSALIGRYISEFT